MGRSKVCKYKVEEFHGRFTTPVVYGVDVLPKDINRHVACMVVATMPGYINESIGYDDGIKFPNLVRYTAQTGANAGNVVMTWKMPSFLLLPDPNDYPEVAKHPNPRPMSIHA